MYILYAYIYIIDQKNIKGAFYIGKIKQSEEFDPAPLLGRNEDTLIRSHTFYQVKY